MFEHATSYDLCELVGVRPVRFEARASAPVMSQTRSRACLTSLIGTSAGLKIDNSVDGLRAHSYVEIM